MTRPPAHAAQAHRSLDRHPRSRRPHVPQRRPPASWLVLAYLAGDNDLEGALLEDFNEMEQVGSRPGVVEILAQVDRAAGYDHSDGDWRTTRRYYVTRGADRRRITSRLLADLGETNTGDPRVLEKYVAAGARQFPARACALILSNHGSGFYVPPEMLTRQGAPCQRELVTRARPGLRRSLFHTTRERVLALDPLRRGIAYDDGSADCLDNRELKAVLANAHRTLGRPVDLVGMDACLMTMLEVAYQMRGHARVLVGSEELEPGDGWPWDTILRDLTARPAMTAAELASTIVRRYVESYEGAGQEATQSAIDLAGLDDLVEAVDALARALLEKLASPGLAAAIHAAWRGALRFFNSFYVDLHHFAGNLAAATEEPPVRRACRQVRMAIEGKGARSPIIAAGAVGSRMRPARGLSVYFPPFRDPSAFYRDLDFARRTRWAEFLEAYLGAGKATEIR